MLWYTVRTTQFNEILAAGEIAPLDGSQFVLFFLDKTVRPPQEEPADADVFRIGVSDDVATKNWYQMKREINARGPLTQFVRMFEKAMLSAGVLYDLRGSADPVPRSKWIAVETFRNGAWVPIDNGE